MALALLPIIVCVPEWEHGACESRCICVCVCVSGQFQIILHNLNNVIFDHIVNWAHPLMSDSW